MKNYTFDAKILTVQQIIATPLITIIDIEKVSNGDILHKELYHLFHTTFEVGEIRTFSINPEDMSWEVL